MKSFFKKSKLRNAVFLIATFCLLFIGCQKENIENSNDHKISTRDVTNFCIASYNAFLLDTPDITGGPQCEGTDCTNRAINVCHYITQLDDNVPDIVTFQEVFEPAACTALSDCMSAAGFGFSTGCPIAVNTVDFNPIAPLDCPCEILSPKGSGLITFSKFPITRVIFEPFNASHGCISDGSDCVANKGILLTDITLPDGCVISVINTHLDAGGDLGSIGARNSQLDQLADFIDQNIPSNQSMFLNGDFNIDVNNVSESDFRDDLNITPNFVLANSDPGSTASDGQVLDYIFVKNGDGKILDITYKVIEETTTFHTQCYWTFTDEWFQLNKQDFEYHYEVINGEPHEPYEPGYLPDTPEQIGSWTDFDKIPKHYRQFVERKCLNSSTTSSNPSDHNPILSCLSYDCDGEIEDSYGNNTTTEPECNGSKPCPEGEECVKGKCQPF